MYEHAYYIDFGAETRRTATGLGAKTTALAVPDGLYVFSPAHRGALVLAESGA